MTSEWGYPSSYEIRTLNHAHCMSSSHRSQSEVLSAISKGWVAVLQILVSPAMSSGNVGRYCLDQKVVRHYI